MGRQSVQVQVQVQAKRSGRARGEANGYIYGDVMTLNSLREQDKPWHRLTSGSESRKKRR